MDARINEIIDDYIQEFYNDIVNEKIDDNKIKKDILNKVKIAIQEEYKKNMFDHPDKNLIKDIEDGIRDRMIEIQGKEYNLNKEDLKELEREIDNIDARDIEKLKKEIENIDKLDDKGKRKKATAKSGRIIRKIKSEIAKIKENDNLSKEEEEALRNLEELLDQQLGWHKNQLKERYNKEFMHGKATVKGIITVLPAGVALQSKKVVNCINQLKEAKTNKERIFRVIELGKELGILALTPVIFTAKFIVKHWYLILLLLLLLKLPAFNFNPQDEKKPYEQTDPQYEPVTVDDLEEVKNPDFGKVPEPVRNPVIGKVPKPGYNPNPYTPGVNVPVTDTGTGGEIDIKIPDVTQPVDITHTVKNPVVGKVPKPGFNPNPYTPGVNVPVTDTATGGKVDIKLPDVSEPVDIKNPVVQPVHTVKNPVVGKVPKPGLNPNPYTPGVNVPVTDTGTGGKVDIKLPDVTQPVDIAEPVLPIVELTEAEQETFAKITNDFLNYLEKNFHVVIGNWHEDIPIVHSPEEFVKFVEENRPLVHVTVEEAEDFYLKNVMNQGAGLAGYSVIWPEIDSVTKYFATETDLVNYILSGENYELTRAFNNFVNQGGNMSLLQRIANAYNPDTFAEYASKVGLSSTMGTLLFVLYEALQYGFAGPTGGLSLVLPG